MVQTNELQVVVDLNYLTLCDHGYSSIRYVPEVCPILVWGRDYSGAR